jgi:hypothetical protein
MLLHPRPMHPPFSKGIESSGPLPPTVLEWAEGAIKKAFWKNEPILACSKIGFKWLIINNLKQKTKVVKKRQLRNEPILGTFPMASNGCQNNYLGLIPKLGMLFNQPIGNAL